MSRRIGSTRASVASAPPTMIESCPASSVERLPETGASSIAAPSSETRAASSRLAVGDTVLMST